jgi:hypothetical protein
VRTALGDYADTLFHLAATGQGRTWSSVATLLALCTGDDADVVEAWGRAHLHRPTGGATVGDLLARSMLLDDPTADPPARAFVVDRALVAWAASNPARRAVAMVSLRSGVPSSAAAETVWGHVTGLEGAGNGLPSGTFDHVVGPGALPRCGHQPLDGVCVTVLDAVGVDARAWSLEITIPAALSVIAATADLGTRAGGLLAFVDSDPPTGRDVPLGLAELVEMCPPQTPGRAAAEAVAATRRIVDRCPHCDVAHIHHPSDDGGSPADHDRCPRAAWSSDEPEGAAGS